MLYIFILSGLALALVFNVTGVQNTQWYMLLTATLLAIGLYSSTFGISIAEARRHVRLILTAVTFGVIMKALLIGGLLSLILQNPFGFILGIIMAQIDPLSTAALMHSKRLSKRAKTIISAWSSFDDPVTVIMSLYVPVLLTQLSGEQWHSIKGTMHVAGVGGYLVQTGINVLFAVTIFVLWLFIKHFAQASRYLVIVFAAIAMYLLVVGSLSVAVYYFWMLGIALLGLFMRPPIRRVLIHSTQWALYMAAILLGMLLVNGINLQIGIFLGFIVYCSQIVVGYLLTLKLAFTDRTRIAFAQQNGITAIILALLFEPYYGGIIGFVAPAIVVVNILHLIASKLLSAYFNNEWKQFTWTVQRERIRLHMKKI